MLKIIPLGGVAQVTKNLFVYQQTETGEILLVDCGIGFPTEEMLGVDVLFPDVSYLRDKKEKIKGIIFSHGHDDHIAGLPYLLEKIGRIPIYASYLTAGLVKNILKDKGLEAEIRILERNLALGSFKITAIPVTHSVPDARHFLIETGNNRIYHGADFKFDFTPVDNKSTDLQLMASVSKPSVDLLLSDCVRVEKEGFSLSEKSLYEVFERELRGCPGRVIFTLISSNINRIQQLAQVSCNSGRKLGFLGRSLQKNIQTAEELGYLQLPRNNILGEKQILGLPREKQILVVTGSQAEPNSVLLRLAENRFERLKLKSGDKVVFSADPIPGNESEVNLLIDKLTEKGVLVSYKGILDDLHVSGHASSGDLRLLINLVRPRHLLPIGGTFRQMTRFRQLAQELGFSENQILLPKEGEIINIKDHQVTIGERLSLNQVIVDGLGIGDVGRIILKERRKMAEDGMVVVVVVLKGKQLQTVRIISRGFVFVRESKALLKKAENLVRSLGKRRLEEKAFKEQIEKKLQKLFFKETEREPLILSLMMHL